MRKPSYGTFPQRPIGQAAQWEPLGSPGRAASPHSSEPHPTLPPHHLPKGLAEQLPPDPPPAPSPPTQLGGPPPGRARAPRETRAHGAEPSPSHSLRAGGPGPTAAPAPQQAAARRGRGRGRGPVPGPGRRPRPPRGGVPGRPAGPPALPDRKSWLGWALRREPRRRVPGEVELFFTSEEIDFHIR